MAHVPYESDLFDFIVCRAAFKNFSNPARALNEMYRVLKCGGTALIIDLRRDAPKKTIDQYIDTIGLNWWDSFVTKWTFELMLKRRAYLKNEITDLVSQTPSNTWPSKKQPWEWRYGCENDSDCKMLPPPPVSLLRRSFSSFSDLADNLFRQPRPHKKIIWFEQSAHRPFEEPEEIQPGLDRRSLAV